MAGPNLILAAALASAVAFGAGFLYGATTGNDKAEAAQSRLAKSHSARVDLETELEAERRKARSYKMDARAATAREDRLRGQLSARETAPRLGCDLSDDGMRNLNSAIANANGIPPPPGRVSDVVPADPVPD